MDGPLMVNSREMSAVVRFGVHSSEQMSRVRRCESRFNWIRRIIGPPGSGDSCGVDAVAKAQGLSAARRWKYLADRHGLQASRPVR